MNSSTNDYLAKEPVGSLMRKYSVPCIISLLVAALYNIVDQIFIANASYLGSYGNAANTVVFPLTVVALAVAVMIGDGACAAASILLGSKKSNDAGQTVGNAVILTIISGIVLTVLYLVFADKLISLFREVVFGVGFALLLPVFFGLDGVLWSMPVSDLLTFVITVFVIRMTFKELEE